MPTSDKQIAANRRNATHSTGPTTPQGRQAVRHNAVTHGLLARETVITREGFAENPEEFHSLLTQLEADRRPQGALETLLVEQIAACIWRLRRAVRADSIQFGNLLQRQDDAFQTKRTNLPSLPLTDDLDTLLRYESAIERALYRALTHLDRLQQSRAGGPVLPPITVDISTET